MAAPRLLALDFDGVVSDSAPESFLVAVRTCRALTDAPLPDAARALAAIERPTLADVVGCPSYAPFVEVMPLGNRAEDFGVVLAALADGAQLGAQADYDAWLARFDPRWRDTFHARFYQERARLRAADEPGWLALMGPYPAFLELLRRRAGEVELAIATAKDGPSVAALLEAYGVRDLFPPERVIDKEAGRSKTAHLKVLQQRTHCEFEDMLFFDDKVNHLEDVAALGVPCALAAWGYNGPREEARARAGGHRVCTLENVEAQVFGG